MFKSPSVDRRKFSRSAALSAAARLAAGLLMLSAATIFAQINTGEISGIVTDPSGAIVPDASVVAAQTATQMQFTSATNRDGEYLLAQLPVGEYSLAVNAQGFKQAVQTNLVLHVGDKFRQDFTLAVGAHSDVSRVALR